MGKIFLYIVLVLGVVGGLVVVANSQNSTKSLQDVVSSLPPTPVPTVATQTAPPQAPQTAVQQQTQQQPPAQSAAQNPSPMVLDITIATKEATIKTTKGDIVVILFVKDAPNTAYNFIVKARAGFYNNLLFHRVEDWVVQGGDPHGDGTGGGRMLTELNDHHFGIGSLGAARGTDIRVSNDAQFFITKKDAPWLDIQYANFGTVTNGMDVVNKLEVNDKILGITIE